MKFKPSKAGDQTIIRLVQNWLIRQDGRAYCDECVAAKLALANRAQVVEAMATLIGNGFDRTRGSCTVCGGPKTVNLTVRGF